MMIIDGGTKIIIKCFCFKPLLVQVQVPGTSTCNKDSFAPCGKNKSYAVLTTFFVLGKNTDRKYPHIARGFVVQECSVSELVVQVVKVELARKFLQLYENWYLYSSTEGAAFYCWYKYYTAVEREPRLWLLPIFCTTQSTCTMYWRQ
jgi:hypothetical protein